MLTRSDVVAGLFCIIPCTDSFVKVDLRTVSFDIPPQEVCTYYNLLFSSVKQFLIGTSSGHYLKTFRNRPKILLFAIGL